MSNQELAAGGSASDRHSGMGVSSFALSIFLAVLFLATFMLAGVMEANAPGVLDNEKSASAIVVGGLMIFGVFIGILGLALGIAGLCQLRRNKVFAVLGVVFNGVVLLGASLLIVIGLSST